MTPQSKNLTSRFQQLFRLTALNIGILVRCAGCSQQRLMYAQRKTSAVELERLKRLFNSFQYICLWYCFSLIFDVSLWLLIFASLQETVVNESSPEHKVLGKNLLRENLSNITNMEAPYYYCQIFPNSCFHCNKSNDLESGDTINYP